MNPSQHDIDAEYNRLLNQPTMAITVLIPEWRLKPACEHGCCEFLILFSAFIPNAEMVAAGELLAERLCVERDMIRWEPLRLHS
jgi:hypothetical protein